MEWRNRNGLSCLRWFAYSIFQINGVLLLLNLQSVFADSYHINTTGARITGTEDYNGKIVNRFFQGPNNGNWNYSVATFTLSALEAQTIFGPSDNNITISGTHALSVNVTGNFTVGTVLDVSGRSVNVASKDKPLFLLGGFVRVNQSCCSLGAGPGGAFSFHGGGHGGRGGGFYQDRNSSRYFGWSYYDTSYLLGGSTGTVLFSSKSGSGGGAIELIAFGGTLTINADIKANGFTSGNTSSEHCAGGSSGGLVRLYADQVVIGKNASLWAVGGDSGYSSNHSQHCGGGGGGGVIQVFSLHDNHYHANSKKHTKGGWGIHNGEDGLEQVAVYFDKQMDLEINTTTCQMKWSSDHQYAGKIEDRFFTVAATKAAEHYKICTIEFTSSIFIGEKVAVKVSGDHGLSLVSRHGNIEIYAPFDMNGTASFPHSGSTFRGGYVFDSNSNIDTGPANFTNCSSADLYGRDIEALLGGSVCFEGVTSPPPNAIGGGALELNAKNGAIVVDAVISADGYSDGDSVGAMGGTLRLSANKIILNRNALLSARGSSQVWMAGGGVIQLVSDSDVTGICRDKFDVSGGTNGLINILVSTANTFQVQYIQQGVLEIDTTHARWMHKMRSNGSMAYSYFGKLEEKQLGAEKYNVSMFDFQTPILINGSAVVKVLGSNSLSVSSNEGIFIGVDIDVGKVKRGEKKMVGGYCLGSASVPGGGPGRGKPNSDGGAGHGGKGGLLFEEGGVVYGNTYGVNDSIHLIGGSAGSSKMPTLVACGGGAIKIYSKKNLTINAAITANGISLSPLNKFSIGGSSGGTIILQSDRHVILGDNALLEAKGADALKATSNSNNFQGGGGGGGVISISYVKGFVGIMPNASVNTKGGNGIKPGDNGLVVVNGTRDYGYPIAVFESKDSYEGCFNAGNNVASKTKKLLAHEVSPAKCILECQDNHVWWALIKLQSCLCYNDNATFNRVNETMCQSRCLSNSSLVCGGSDAYSMYKTGYRLSSSVIPSSPSITSAIYPSKSSVVVATPTSAEKPTTSVVVTTAISEPPTSTEEPTTIPSTEPSEKFKELENITLTASNVTGLVETLRNLTSQEELNGGDVRVTLKIFKQISNNENLIPQDKEKSQALAESLLTVASSLLSKENVDNWGVSTEEESGTATVTSQAQLLEIVEDFGLMIGQQLADNETRVVESRNVAMGVEIVIPDDSEKGSSFPRYDKLSADWAGKDSVLVSKELLDKMAADNRTKTVVVYALYNDISEHFPTTSASKESSQKTIVNSRIIALKFNKQLKAPFTKPISLWFDKLQSAGNVTAPSCSFLDFTDYIGKWSDKGCHVVKQETSSVECACDHLTNFAILMQVKDFEISAEHLKTLTVITYVGCGISLFGLALTLATFLSLETLASERTSIHKNLVVALGLAQIVFLAGIDATYNPIACKAVALFLHYLYTAAFTWMLCEGIHLYSKVVEVFSEGSKMKYYYALGWGLPLTIVFISAAARWNGYGTEQACWISIHQGLIWAFVAPVLVISTVNFVVMIMVIKVVITSVTSLQNPGNTSQVKAGMKGMVVLLPLLGLTWVFGIMAINEDTIVFQYLFAIFNSLQGVFIFAFHCIGNTEVRVAYKRLHEKRTLARSLPEHSLTSSHHPREKKRMDSRETNLTGEDEIVITKTIRSVSDVKLSGDNMAMQTFGDADSGRWSLNCPSPDPFLVRDNLVTILDQHHPKRA